MNQKNGSAPDGLGGLGDLLPAEVLKELNELLEQLHRLVNINNGSTIINIYKEGSLYVDHVDSQNFYGDKWAKSLLGKETTERMPPPNLPFNDSTPLSALFRENHHEGLRQVIESWRPYLIDDDTSIDTLAITHFEFDKKRIYSNRVYYDLLDLDALGALQVPLSNLAHYLAEHSNLSSSYDTLYRQLKKYRKELP